MRNSILEDVLLLAAGGIIGLVAGASIMSDEPEDEEDEPVELEDKGVNEIFAALNDEVRQAMESCETEEERTEVRERILQSIRQLQDDLSKGKAQETVKISEEDDEMKEVSAFVNLGAGEMPKPEESFVDQRVRGVQRMLSQLSESLDPSRTDARVTNPPSAPVTSCDL